MTDILGNVDVNSTSEAVSTESVAAPEVQEKMIPQSTVNRIAAQKARDAEERTERRLRAEFEAEKAKAASSTVESSTPPAEGDRMRQAIRQEAEAMRQEEHQRENLARGEQILNSYAAKLDAYAIDKPEFAELYPKLAIENHPVLLIAAHEADNTGDVLAELGNNPAKYSNLIVLAANSPQLAKLEMQRLSDSIKKNQEALQQPTVKPPLSHVKPSLIGSGSDSNLSVSDFRKMFRG